MSSFATSSKHSQKNKDLSVADIPTDFALQVLVCMCLMHIHELQEEHHRMQEQQSNFLRSLTYLARGCEIWTEDYGAFKQGISLQLQDLGGEEENQEENEEIGEEEQEKPLEIKFEEKFMALEKKMYILSEKLEELNRAMVACGKTRAKKRKGEEIENTESVRYSKKNKM